MALSWFLQNPDAVAASVKQMTRPGEVSVSQMNQSFGDLSRGVLGCYHRTGRLVASDIVERPWAKQAQYGADSSVVIRLKWRGLSSNEYQTIVAVLSKSGRVRAAVLSDSAMIPYSKRCVLENWTGN